MTNIVTSSSKAPAFTPPSQPLCTIGSASFKAFATLMGQLVNLNGPRPLSIKNSRMLEAIGSQYFWVDIDLSNIIKPTEIKADIDPQPKGKSAQGVSFDFQASATDIGNLAGLAVDTDVTIHDHGNELVFANGYTEVSLSKPFPQAATSSVTLPTEEDRLGEEVKLEGNDLAAVRSTVSKSKAVFLLIYAGQLEQVEVRGKNPCRLRKNALVSLGDRSPELTLISQHFLALTGKVEATVGIYHNEHGYWLKTSSEPSMIKLTTYELLHCAHS